MFFAMTSRLNYFSTFFREKNAVAYPIASTAAKPNAAVKIIFRIT